MRRFFCFWWLCVKLGARGVFAFANDWQWLIGIPVVAGVMVYGLGKQDPTAIPMTSNLIVNGVIAAFAVFFITASVRFLFGIVAAAPNLYWNERNSVIELTTKITSNLHVIYDPTDPSCDVITQFTDGRENRCVRLRVENISTSRIISCEGWLRSLREMPRLSPAQLFWIDIPVVGEVDLLQKIPRYLQIFRIDQDNKIQPATWGKPPTPCELWPVDLQNKFVSGEKYLFKIGVKARDETATIFYNVELNWNGDYKTAEITSCLSENT